MDLYKSINAHVVKPIWLKYLRLNHLGYIKELEKFHNYSYDEIKEYQLKKIQEICAASYASVPFYRKEWKKIGLVPGRLGKLRDLQDLPILTKEILKKHHDEIISKRANKQTLIVSGTGGTTDSPIEILYDRQRLMFKTAEMDFFRRWWDWERGDKVAYLWGAPQDIPNIKSLKWKIINKIVGRSLYMFASLLDPNIMTEYIKQINRFRPGIIQCYPNPCYILSKFIQKNKIKIHRPKSIVLTAEPCTDYQRDCIQKAFSAPVYTFYGCREGGYVAVECGEHDGYHINCSSLYMEIIKDNTHAKPGEIGNIVFTDLLNKNMPFIRYQIGDLGIFDDKVCACGSTLPKMKFFAGRETDVFVTPEGKFVPGVSLCDRIIEDCQGIRALQFIQNEPEQLNVKIVKGRAFSEKDLKELDERIYRYFERSVKVSKIFVDDIPKEKSGKTRFCISNVPKNI